MKLVGRRALVTGAAGGQGQAVARRFVDEGCAVALLDVDERGLGKVARQFGAEVLPIVADGRDEPAVAAAVARAATELGGLDILYNNAGVYLADRDAPVDTLELAVWREVIDANATSVFLCCKHALPHLLASGRGVVINVASTAAYAGDPDCHAYAASKGALLALTRSIAQRWGAQGLRAVALCPGFISTPMTDFARSNPTVWAAIEDATALKRAGTPEEVAAVAAFLVSDDASYLTSCAVDVHGGLVK